MKAGSAAKILKIKDSTAKAIVKKVKSSVKYESEDP
jgi:hypothetical protein